MRARTLAIAAAATIGIALLALAIFVATFDANRYKPQLAELVRAHTGRTLSLEGDLALSLWPRIGLSTGPAALSGQDGRGESARIEGGTLAIPIRPLLSGRLQIEAIALRGLSVALDAAQPAQGWRLEAAELRAGPVADREPGQLELDGRLRSAASGADLALAIESGYLAELAAGRVALDGLKAGLEGAVAGLARVRAIIGGQARLDLNDRSAVAERLTIEASAPDGPKLALAGSGRASLAPESAELELKGTLDDGTVAISARLDRFAPLSARWELTAGEVDLDRLSERFAAIERSAPPPAKPAPAAGPDRGAGAAGAAGGRPAPPPAGRPAAEPAMPAIADVETRGKLKVGQLRVSGLTISELAGSAATGAGRIAVESLTGKLNGGALQARVAMAAAGHRLAGSLAGVDAGSLVREASGRDALEGRGDLRFDLATRGFDADSALRDLGGTASFALRDGAVKGVDLDRLMGQVRAALEGRLPVEGPTRAGDRTPFQSLTASFRIAGGVATSSDLDLQADWLRASGEGRVDLPARTLDWLVRATMTGSPGAGAGDAAARRDVFQRLQGVPVPIRLSGRFDDLRYRVEVRDLAAGVARKEVERRLTEKLEERLGLQPAQPASPEAPKDPLRQLKDLLRR
ncbi:AsmA family protein [Burkholderiaceae bacterium FT117]|uniref:AsmA family protein n=1 Tax=Zeimonas sediminis TaxID=2944268 RepID=UPI002342D801|nr:AsmA family protein [Zeimonas sediminis]MCM5572346.1 AsmA family protein [Zeimonas sediminis]